MPQHHQIATEGGNVDSCPPVPHGEVGVRPGLDQHLGALLTLRLLNSVNMASYNRVFDIKKKGPLGPEPELFVHTG